MNKDILANPLITLLLSLNLPTKDYAIMAGGSIFAHGLKDLINDIDVIARGEAWNKVVRMSTPTAPKSGNGKVVYLYDGKLEIFNSWAPGDWDVNELIDTAEIIEGIRFVRLEYVKEWLVILGRDSDMPKIKIIDEYLNNTKR